MMRQREEHNKFERESWSKQREDDMKWHADLEKRIEDDRRRRDEEAERLRSEQYEKSLEMQQHGKKNGNCWKRGIKRTESLRNTLIEYHRWRSVSRSHLAFSIWRKLLNMIVNWLVLNLN